MHSPVSDPRQMDLFEGTMVALSKLPWQGRSPRALTKGHKRFILKAQAGGSMGEFVDPEQYDLWRRIKKAPWRYQGAPLLVGGVRHG